MLFQGRYLLLMIQEMDNQLEATCFQRKKSRTTSDQMYSSTVLAYIFEVLCFSISASDTTCSLQPLLTCFSGRHSDLLLVCLSVFFFVCLLRYLLLCKFRLFSTDRLLVLP